jgi:hypothetical protein
MSSRPPEEGRRPGGRILVVFDGSVGAGSELRSAIEAAHERNATVELVAIAARSPWWIPVGAISMTLPVDLKEEVLRVLGEELAAARDAIPASVSVSTRIVQRKDRKELCRRVEAGDYDLVLSPPARLSG